MKCPIPSCEGILDIIEESAQRGYSGDSAVKYHESTKTTRRCNKCGLFLQFYNFKEVKGSKDEWRCL